MKESGIKEAADALEMARQRKAEAAKRRVDRVLDEEGCEIITQPIASWVASPGGLQLVFQAAWGIRVKMPTPPQGGSAK